MDKKQFPQLIINDDNLPHTLSLTTPFHNSNLPSSKLEYTIKRKRSLTSLNPNQTQYLSKINKTPSPKHVNKPVSSTSSLTLKDNNYIKNNVLHQKFHQLSLNPTQKKPLKLRLSKLNCQNPNHLLKQHLNDFSKQLDSKLQTQNNIIKHSLQKIQKFVINHAKSPLSQTNDQHLISELHQVQVQVQDNKQIGRNQIKSQRSYLKKNKKSKQSLKRQKEDEQKSQIKKTHLINSMREEDNCSFSSTSCNKLENLQKENDKLKLKIKQLIDQNININQQLQERQNILKENKQLTSRNLELIQEHNQTIEKNKQILQKNKQLIQNSKQLKTINSFLVSENYRLSLEISFLKNKILQYEQKEYQQANSDSSLIIKSQKNQEKEQLQNQQIYSHSLLKSSQSQSKQNLNDKEKIPQREGQVSRRDILIKQIKTQNFSLINKQINDQQQLFTINQMKSYKNLLNSNLQIDPTLQNHIAKLSQKISQLQQQLLQQKNANQNLSNKLAVLKLQQHGVKRQSKKFHKQNKSLDSVVSIKINLQSQDPSDFSQQNSQNLKKTASFHQSVVKTKKSQASLENISHKVSKSKILSNQFIYFAQILETPKQPHKSSPDNKQSDYQQKNDINQTRRDQINPLGTIKQEDEDEKKKTLCMKKLQIPAEQIRKRRKSMTQQLNISLQKKGNRKKNVNNSLSFYSKQKIAQLQILKQTISLKFQAFKYTYELFQSQMILWPNRTATTKDLKSILSEYPFLLEETSIDLLLSYCDASDTDGIGVDIFCNKMREFIAEYSEITEQQELILEKKILKRWKYTSQQILDLMRKLETVSGEITKDAFMSVLEEFKFEENEIHHLLSQSVAISPDLNRIKYKHYLDNFLAKN